MIMNEATIPQKRDKSLVPLSREHHFGLLFCWKLRQGLKNGADLQVMRSYVNYFWNNILKVHCEEEEWMLNRLLPKEDPMQLQLKEEHRLLKAMIDLIAEGSPMNKGLFKVLQQDLVNHIRWEERQLFPYLQAVVNSNELETAGKLLEHRHAVQHDTFTPEFWAHSVNRV
ncbi:hemerythrin domain-containing protein [Pontibacter sp. E15-1]|uniref:hemerythrin domain-containing protein n=1 Tax=Pontibacter sp. E15-1 TaxID=2919918 RepID=UPI001F502A89|nr:hemerythrin domain-containing protein [Pontibacter sp. E15-1]MCJ8163304.1 hemerythrin domain-containing protein [Pontibacter sp. E15-1]